MTSTRNNEVGKVDSRRVYDGKTINVDVDRVRFPDGKVGELEMVRHPGASAVVPMLSDIAGPDPELLLLKQYRYAAESFIYEIPAGKLDKPGEDPAECARRELREETGCSAESVEHLTTIYTTPGFTDEKIHLFVATGLTRGEHERDANEYIEIETVTMSRALELVRDGQIQDAKTIVALLYVAGFRS